MEPWLLWLIFIALALEGIGVCFLMMKIYELEDEIQKAKSAFLHALNDHEKNMHNDEA